MGIWANRLPTPRELIRDWTEGIEGNLKDMLDRRVVRRLRNAAIQLLKDNSRSKGDGWFIMYDMLNPS